MIEVRNLSCEIGGKQIIDDITLRVDRGDHIVITGSSGAGKSSLLKALMGGLSGVTGTISLDGIELTNHSVENYRSRIIYIPQEPQLGAENVRDALLLPFTFKRNAGTHPTDRQIEALLAEVGLYPEIQEASCNSLSGGERQRIAIVRSLLLNKTIIVADEVTSALDPANKNSVMNLLFKQNHTILSVSHDKDWIERCSRVITMHQGSLTKEHGNEWSST